MKTYTSQCWLTFLWCLPVSTPFSYCKWCAGWLKIVVPSMVSIVFCKSIFTISTAVRFEVFVAQWVWYAFSLFYHCLFLMCEARANHACQKNIWAKWPPITRAHSVINQGQTKDVRVCVCVCDAALCCGSFVAVWSVCPARRTDFPPSSLCH